MNDLRTDLAALYLKAGLKEIGITFVMTDSHIADEKFLVLINDMLAFGEISELFADDEVDTIVDGIRNEVLLANRILNISCLLKDQYTECLRNHG